MSIVYTKSFIIAQVIGILALIVLMLSFQKNDKKVLLKYQTFSSLLYAIQYVFLGAYTGCLMNLTCMARNVVFNKYNNQKIPFYNQFVFKTSSCYFVNWDGVQMSY